MPALATLILFVVIAGAATIIVAWALLVAVSYTHLTLPTILLV